MVGHDIIIARPVLRIQLRLRMGSLTIATPAAVEAICENILGCEGAAEVAGTCDFMGTGGARLGAVLMGRDVPPSPLLGEEPNPNPPRLRGIFANQCNQ